MVLSGFRKGIPMKPIISPVGDCAISIDFGQVIDPKINRHIRQTIERIQELNLDGIIELVPTYCALLLQYDAMLYSYAELCNSIEPTLEQTVTDNANELVMQELRSTFKPEFINRIDEIIIFNSLTKDVVYDILNKIIKDIEYRLRDKNIKINVTDKAKEFIVNASYDEKYGARPIKRYVQRNVETLIAEAIINDKISFGSTITIDVDSDKLILK